MVNRKSLDMPLHGGGTKKTPMNLEFVRLEDGVDSIVTTVFLEKMFDGFFASYNGRYENRISRACKRVFMTARALLINKATF